MGPEDRSPGHFAVAVFEGFLILWSQHEILKSLREEGEKLSIYMHWMGSLTTPGIEEKIRYRLLVQRDTKLRCVGRDEEEIEKILDKAEEDRKIMEK